MGAAAKRETWEHAGILTAGFVVLLWTLEIVDVLLGNALDQWGVRPRTDEGLLGVLFAPLLHFGWGHLIANTVPVAVLCFLVLMSGIGRGLLATAIIWAVAGLGVWTFAGDYSVHAGASSLIFGWIVYLIARGFFTAQPIQILIGVGVFLFYGGTLLGALPGTPGVSWQGHLFGALGGLLAARMIARDRRPRPVDRA